VIYANEVHLNNLAAMEAQSENREAG